MSWQWILGCYNLGETSENCEKRQKSGNWRTARGKLTFPLLGGQRINEDRIPCNTSSYKLTFHFVFPTIITMEHSPCEFLASSVFFSFTCLLQMKVCFLPSKSQKTISLFLGSKTDFALIYLVAETDTFSPWQLVHLTSKFW